MWFPGIASASKRAVKVELDLPSHVVHLSHTSRSSDSCDARASAPTRQDVATTLRGSVRIKSQRTVALEHLRVDLIGTRTRLLEGSSTQSCSIGADLLYYASSPSFVAGTHIIEFALPIPSSLAPSLQSDFGNQEYKIQLNWSEHGCRARKQSISVSVLATLPRSVNSADAEFQLRNGAMTDIIGRHPAIGPYTLRVTSPDSTIGSEAFFDLIFMSPPAGTTLVMVAVKLVQTITNTSSKRKQTLVGMWNTRTGLRKQHSPPSGMNRPAVWTEGQQAVCAEARTRLTRHSDFLPSTPICSDTDLRVDHVLETSIHYIDASGSAHSMRVTNDVCLISCRCIDESLVPPLYEGKASVSRAVDFKAGNVRRQCACERLLPDWMPASARKLDAVESVHGCRPIGSTKST